MKTTAFLRRLVVASGLALAAFAAHSDDIDLYTGGGDVTGVTSNVLIILDNSTNWASAAAGWPAGKQGQAELEALRSVLTSLPGGVNVGLMMASNASGGYVRYSVRDMQGIVASDCSGQSDSKKGVFCRTLKTMQDTFGNDGASEDKINAASVNYDHLMNSVFRYFNGEAPWLHNPAPKTDMRDFAGNVNNIARSLGEHSLDTADAPAYNSPAAAAQGCARNFIIFIGNGYPNLNGTAAELTAAGALLDPPVVPDLTPVSGGDPNKFADEWARFLFRYGVQTDIADPNDDTKKLFNKVATYTIDVCSAGQPNTCDPDQARLLGKMASEGGGRYFRSTTQDEIRKSLALIFAEIQAINSQFAAAALPVSVTTKGTFANQVYIGVFKPDSNSQPRWFGNLKAYKFAGYCDWDEDRIVDSGEILSTDSAASEAIGNKAEACQKFCDSNANGELDSGETTYNDPDDTTTAACGTNIALLPFPRYNIYLATKTGQLAENQTTDIGFIAESAQSFWTHDSSFWNFKQTTAAGSSDNPDGPNVERGGAAQRLRDQIATTDAATGAQAANLAQRTVYTCLTGTCSASLQRFETTNTDLRTRLQSADTPKTITAISRSGDTLTVTTSGAHGFSVGNLVTISGITPGEYNLDSVPVNAVSSTTQFQIEKAGLEQPPVSIAAKLTTGAGVPVSGIEVFESGTAEASLTGATPAWLGQSVAISGVSAANSDYLGGVVVVTAVAADGSSIEYAINNLPEPATTKGTARTTGPAINLAAVTRTGNVAYATAAESLGTRYPVGALVTVKNTEPPAYRVVDRPIIACPTPAEKTFCYELLLDEPAGTLTATLLDASAYDVTITRTLNANTATVTLNDPALTLGGIGIVAGSSIGISGTSTAYDGNWTAAAVATPSFNIGPVVLGPQTPGVVAGTSQVKAASYIDPVNFIEWTLGKENGVEDENQDGVKSGYRASIHGDVLHSRPLMIQLASDQVVGFYGANDGFLRAISAGLGDSQGAELWSFIPPEFIPNVTDPTANNGLIRLYNNGPLIRYPHLQCTLQPNPVPRTYFWDGAISQGNSEALELMGDKRIIYATMRRGGRTVYALDVTAPTAPKIAWKFSNTTPVPGSDPAVTFSSFGQSWSEAKVVVFKQNDATRIPVVIMGGGYNGGVKSTGEPEEDDRPPGSVRGSTDGSLVGRGIYLIHAEQGPVAGKVLHLKPTDGLIQFSIPSDLTAVDTDRDGYPDRIYAVDSGGNAYRWQLTPGADPFVSASWAFKRVASVANSGAVEDRRKFLSRPAAMPIVTTTQAGYMLLFGSGDREKPLANKKFVRDPVSGVRSCTSAPQYNATVACNSFYTNDNYFSGGIQIDDRFYGVLDSNTDNSLIDEGDLTQIVNPDTNTVDGFSLADSDRGWFLDLLNNQLKLDGNECPKGEEKMVDQPVFSGGYVKFATNAPRAPDVTGGVCSNLGQAREYILNPLTGLGKGVQDGDQYSIDGFSTALTDGYTPEETSGVVQIGERFVKFETRGAGGTNRDPVNASARRNRVYWHYQVD